MITPQNNLQISMEVKNFMKHAALITFLNFVVLQAEAQRNNMSKETSDITQEQIQNMRFQLASVYPELTENRALIDSLNGYTFTKEHTLEELQITIKNLIVEINKAHIARLKETPKTNDSDRLLIEEKDDKYIIKWFDMNLYQAVKIITSQTGEIQTVSFNREKVDFKKLFPDERNYIIEYVNNLVEKIESK